jgi:type III pantothenate kinase
MLLAVDIGNTRIKTAVFEQNTLLKVLVFTKEELVEKINFILDEYQKINIIVVASVGNLEKEVFLTLEKRARIIFISKNTKFPFNNLYATPATLGIDRMVLASGAVLKYNKQARLIIDAGTCITYDYIDENDNYLGGAISPGIRLRYESLHQFTAKLPLLSKSYPEKVIGNSTEESIHSGVINGLTNEIDGFIDYYRTLNANFIIILTGGDAEFLAMRLKNTIFANPNFLLESLNQTFQYNQK